MWTLPCHRNTFRDQLQVTFIALIGSLMLLCAIYIGLMYYHQSISEQALQSSERLAQVYQLDKLLVERRSQLSEYLITREPGTLARYQQIQHTLEATFDTLEQLPVGNPEQRSQLQELRVRSEQWYQDTQPLVAHLHTSPAFTTTLFLHSLQRDVSTIQALDATVVAAQATEYARHRQAASFAAASAFGGSVLFALGLVNMGVLVTRRRRKELVARHEQALAAVQAQSDELGALRRRYEMLLNATDEGIFGLDVQGKVTFINSAAARILGWMPEELLGQSLHERIHHTYADGTPYPCECCPILETLHMGTMRKLTDDLFWHKNGTAIPVEYVSSPIADGEIVAGVVVVFRDVGDRRRLESQLLQSQKLESIGRLAGGIAHDFNNLLTTIAACAELARDTLPSDHAVQTDLGIILEAAARANILTHQLLSFARKQSIATEIFNLNDLLDGIGELLRRTLGMTIELTIYPAADLWLINADPNQIAQVLLNLVINARDAMSENGKLMIETANVELDSAYHLQHPGLIPGSYVVLSVSDNGEGIPADVQPQIFEPFFTTKASDKGTGLGLSTSYGIVTQHGGQIWMYSEVGQGTTFKVYLPSVHSEPAHVSELITPLNWGIETVLLVEDQEQVRTLACQLLRDYGYTILAAANGETGLQLAQGHAGTIDLLITDIVMPDLGGVQLAKQLALQRSGIKILFISGYPERMLVSNGRLALEQQVLHKPFTAAELLQAVRLALDT